MNKADIQNWFNVGDINHLAAWRHLEKTGAWPANFIPSDVQLSAGWQMQICVMLAKAYLDLKVPELTDPVAKGLEAMTHHMLFYPNDFSGAMWVVAKYYDDNILHPFSDTQRFDSDRAAFISDVYRAYKLQTAV